MDYKTVLKLFKEAGFIDIKTQIKYDIITGWINSDGDIESITINGYKKFDEFSIRTWDLIGFVKLWVRDFKRGR